MNTVATKAMITTNNNISGNEYNCTQSIKQKTKRGYD